jgi:HEAT repeat protein
MARPLLLVLSAVLLLAAPSAGAATQASAPAGGGLPAMDVRVDLARAVVEAGGATIPIALEPTRLPAADDVTVEALDVGQGKHVVHVRVPARDAGTSAAAWEAVLAGGRGEPLFAGVTGFVDGDPGERTGKGVQVIESGDTSFVLVGDVREDLRLCGDAATLLDPQALYPGSLSFRPATVQRLSAERRAKAVPLAAKATGAAVEPALARLLVARGSSVPESRGAEITDGDPKTAWRELRPGAGQGEFVVMAAPADVPIARLQIALPPKESAEGGAPAAPKTLYLATSSETFEVTLPADAPRRMGEAFEVAFPTPIRSACLSLVLGDAYAQGMAHPDVGIAEAVAYSEFDARGATLDDVAKHLSGDRGLAAAQVLERAGPAALDAIAAIYKDLDPRGRAHAIDVAASLDRCEDAAPLLAKALCEKTGEAPRKAHEKLERCPGAAPFLAKELREDAASRSCIAPVLAALAPASALDPIADALAATPAGDRAARATLRAAFATALPEAPPGSLAAILGDRKRSAPARLEVMRAAGERAAEAPREGDEVAAELAAASPSLDVRYLLLGPLGVLAGAGDAAAAARIAAAVAHDPDWPVRARAAELGAGLPAVRAALVQAAHDREPRVREAALAALAIGPPPDAVRAAAGALARDGWSFVRGQAVKLLMNAPPNGEVDGALEDALGDGSARVRGAVVLALARRRAVSARGAVRRRLDDTTEEVEVRAAAATALGVLCDNGSVDRLVELARELSVPGADQDTQTIGLGAIMGLAAFQPRDLRGRLAPLLGPPAPPYVRVAAQQALAARAMCH